MLGAIRMVMHRCALFGDLEYMIRGVKCGQHVGVWVCQGVEPYDNLCSFEERMGFHETEGQAILPDDQFRGRNERVECTSCL
jgi:hypothetical protein